MQNQVGQNVERMGKCSSSTLMLKQSFLAGEGVEIAADGVHLAGDISRRPVVVPLKTMCSMKCEMPLTRVTSSREPDLIHIPMEMERMCDISSLRTINPFGRTSLLIFLASPELRFVAAVSIISVRI